MNPVADNAAGGAHRRLRILSVIKVLGFGGAERLLVETVATMDRDAFECEVAYVLDAHDGLAPTIRDGGTPVHSLGATRSADLRWVLHLRTLIREGSFDVVQVKDATGHEFATRLSNVFVVGKGDKPMVSLPKGKGVRLTILQEQAKIYNAAA